MQELLKVARPEENEDMHTHILRTDYMLMLIGSYDSPLGQRREIKPEELSQYGQWVLCTTAPTESGWYLLNGEYGDLDGKWDNAVLPAYYNIAFKEWECGDGHFSDPRQWMEVPFLANVWEAAEAMVAK